VKNANFFVEKFGENIFKIITSVPGRTACEPRSHKSKEIVKKERKKEKFITVLYFRLVGPLFVSL
jgi:predicted nucleic acid-binding Zn ribbon protein